MKNVTALKNGTGDTLAEEGVLQVGKKGDGRLLLTYIEFSFTWPLQGIKQGKRAEPESNLLQGGLGLWMGY